MSLQYATDTLDYLYEDGTRDLIFFGQILGVVSYDNDDILFDKTNEERISDALKFARYLISLNDFDVGQMKKQLDDTLVYTPFSKGFEELYLTANNLFKKNGIDDSDLNLGIRLRKLNNHNPPSKIPHEIIKLFD